MKSSIKTTLFGVATILTAIGAAAKAFLDNDPTTNFDLPSLITAVTAGIGLIMARDNGVTSEDVGVK